MFFSLSISSNNSPGCCLNCMIKLNILLKVMRKMCCQRFLLNSVEIEKPLLLFFYKNTSYVRFLDNSSYKCLVRNYKTEAYNTK